MFEETTHSILLSSFTHSIAHTILNRYFIKMKGTVSGDIDEVWPVANAMKQKQSIFLKDWDTGGRKYEI